MQGVEGKIVEGKLAVAHKNTVAQTYPKPLLSRF
jgi:hypothetical protein